MGGLMDVKFFGSKRPVKNKKKTIQEGTVSSFRARIPCSLEQASVTSWEIYRAPVPNEHMHVAFGHQNVTFTISALDYYLTVTVLRYGPQ